MEKFLEFGSRGEYFEIEIRPTSKCNYKCYYCTSNRNNDNPIVKLNTTNINKIINTSRKYAKKPVKLYIVGGEPTVYPHLLDMVNDICKELKQDDLIEVQSNLAKNIKWIEKFTNNINDLSKFRFSASYHNTQCKNFKEFIEKCKFLKEKNILGTIAVMYNIMKDVTSNWFIFNKLFEDHIELAYLVEPTVKNLTVKANQTIPLYSTKEIEYMNKDKNLEYFKKTSPFYFDKTIPYKTDTESGLISRYDLWLNKKNDFAGHTCEISKDAIFIDWDGNCYRCPNDRYSDVSPVMNTQSENFDCLSYFKYNTTIICPYSWCCPMGAAQYKKGKCVKPDIERVICNV
jgi:organic radical activating enzyme